MLPELELAPTRFRVDVFLCVPFIVPFHRRDYKERLNLVSVSKLK